MRVSGLATAPLVVTQAVGVFFSVEFPPLFAGSVCFSFGGLAAALGWMRPWVLSFTCAMIGGATGRCGGMFVPKVLLPLALLADMSFDIGSRAGGIPVCRCVGGEL